MTTAALYYSAPYDTFFAIPLVLLVWYALDREVVKHYARKRQERESEPDWMWPPRPKDLDSAYGRERNHFDHRLRVRHCHGRREF